MKLPRYLKKFKNIQNNDHKNHSKVHKAGKNRRMEGKPKGRDYFDNFF